MNDLGVAVAFILLAIVFIVLFAFYSLIRSYGQRIRNLISASNLNHLNAVNAENINRNPVDRVILINGVGDECEVYRQIVPIQNEIVNVETNSHQLIWPPSHCEDLPPSYEECCRHRIQDYQREFTQINSDQHFVSKSNT